MARSQGIGWFRTRKQSKGEFVFFCHYSKDPATGDRKEKFHKFGLVSEFPDEPSRWKEVGRLGLSTFIDNPISALTFGQLVARYISSGAIGQKNLAMKKANGTIYVIRHNLEDHCLPRWSNTAVCEMDTKSLEEWLVSLHEKKGLAWATVSGKVKQAMQGVFKFGRKEKFLPKDFSPFKDIDCAAASDYEAITCTPEQTLAILQQLEEPEFILTLVIAATALSISEALGLQWGDVEYDWHQIVVRRSWVEEIGNCKNASRKAPVPMHTALAEHLKHWHEQTMYARPTDWVFASSKLKGAKPRCGSIASQTYLYPAAVKAGVLRAVEVKNGDGKFVTHYFNQAGKQVKRWGWHNLRHSLATWMISQGVDPKTISTILRHADGRMLGTYSHVVGPNLMAAQGLMMGALGCDGAGPIG
jgi:integrase